MQVYLYIEINVFALIILLLIYTNIRHKIDKHLTEQKLFLSLLFLTGIILIADTFTWIFDGRNGTLGKYILVFAMTIYYFLHPVICMNWALYVDFQLNRSTGRIRKLLAPMSVPIIINTVFSILSNFGDYYFYFDSNNIYHRGQFFLLVPFISFSYVAYTVLYVIRNRNRIHSPFYLSFLMFAVPPFIGAMLQMAFYGVVLIWVGMTISILIIFINIQNEQMYMDYLTGLFNRRQLDFYLQELIQKSKKKIGGIMLDINSFKHINDSYGHYIGDEALKLTSQLLKKTFGSNAFIARYGGDEFVILLEVSNRNELYQAIETLKENVQEYNALNDFPYEIDFSIGADLYPGKLVMSEQEFLNYIDSLMYKDKQTMLKPRKNMI